MMAQLGTSSKAHAPNVWHMETNKHVVRSQGLSQTSRGLRGESHSIDKATRHLQKATQNQVEHALQGKMDQSAHLLSSIKSTHEAVEADIRATVADKAKLDRMLAEKRAALELAVQRYQLRGTRPSREHTSDDVQNLLCKQQSQLQKSIKTVEGCIRENEQTFKRLSGLRMALEADMQDKGQGLDLDAKALSLDGYTNVEGSHMVGTARVPFRPTNWGRKTSQLITDCKSSIADSERLRRRVAKVDTDLAAAEADLMREVQKALKVKMCNTMDAATALDNRLKHGYKEIESANKTKEKLAMALDQKDVPLTLVQQRYAARHSARPTREAVHDQVESALTSEFVQLNSMVKELNKKHKKVSNTIKQLNTDANTLESNLMDKKTAYDVDAQCFRMAQGWRPSVTM